MGLTVGQNHLVKFQIHRYDNVYSRECANMGVPYQYSGFLFDSIQGNVYDQVRDINLFPTKSSHKLPKIGNFLKVGDSLIQHYQQGYLRVEVSKITTHKNIYVRRWVEEPHFMTGKDLIDRGFIEDPYDATQWKHFVASWIHTDFWDNMRKLQQDQTDDTALSMLKANWYKNPKAGRVIAPRTADREWRLYNHDLYAVPKERALYLKIQE